MEGPPPPVWSAHTLTTQWHHRVVDGSLCCLNRAREKKGERERDTITKNLIWLFLFKKFKRVTRNTKSVEEWQRTLQRSQRHVRRHIGCRRCLSASRLADFVSKNRRCLYHANPIFRTVVEPVLHVSDRNFDFRQEKNLSLSINYQK